MVVTGRGECRLGHSPALGFTRTRGSAMAGAQPIIRHWTGEPLGSLASRLTTPIALRGFLVVVARFAPAHPGSSTAISLAAQSKAAVSGGVFLVVAYTVS